MKEDGVVLFVETIKKIMKKSKENVCHKCGEEGKFFYNHTWWCSYRVFLGEYNLFGRCKTLNIEDTNTNEREEDADINTRL